MGAKIIFSFLSDSNKVEILNSSYSALENSGWEYNKYNLGEYTYWIDAPIWNFGNSVTKKESTLNYTNTKQSVNEIIELLSQYYTPTINIGIKIYDLIVEGILSVFEGEKQWKNVNFSVDREKLIDTIDKNIREESIKILRRTFSELCIKLKPYYGIGATEYTGVENSPNKIPRRILLGDLNYFSLICLEKIELNIDKADYDKINMDNGKSYYLKDKIFKFE